MKMIEKMMVVVLGTAFSLPLMAQQAAPATPSPAASAPAQHAAHAYEALNLTPDQKQLFQQTLREQHDKVMALRSDSSLQPADRQQQIHKIRMDTVTTLRASLNDDQKTQFDAIQQQMRQRMQAHRNHTPEASAPAPTSND